LLFFFVFPLTAIMSDVIFESLIGVTIVTVSVALPVHVVVLASTVTVVSPTISFALFTSATYIFCFHGERNTTPLLNFFCPASSWVNSIALLGLGIVSPNVSEIKIIDPLYEVTVFLSLSIARTVTSMASLALAVLGAIISNPTTVSSAARDASIGISERLTKTARRNEESIFRMMKKL